MGASSNSVNIQDNELYIFDDSEKIKDLEEIINIPNDQYTCTECHLIPEIINIDYELCEIEFKCKNHGTKKIFIKDYFIESSQYNYINYKCHLCNNVQRDFIQDQQIAVEENENSYDNIFKYCYVCKKILCPNCTNKHSHKNFLPVNFLNNKCKEHYEEDNFNEYCITCGENICNNTKDTTHKDHFIETISKLNPKEEDINLIKNKNNLIKKNIELLEILYKINNTILNTYQVSKCNYYHNLNVDKLIKSIKNNFPKLEEGLKSLFYKLNNKQKTLFNKINKRFNIKITGNENKLNLSHKNLKSEDLNIFSGIKFSFIKELSLQNNNINMIDVLDYFDMPNVRWINLSYNKIEFVSNLKNIYSKMPKLEKLNLKSNYIKNIDVLNEVEFPNIKEINIQNNDQIDFQTDMAKNIIKKYNNVLIYQLTEEEKQNDLIYLFNERYDNEYTLEDVKINLTGKNLGNDGLKIFSDIHFSLLLEVNLSYNNIKTFNDLETANFPQLEVINISNNDIKDISTLQNLKFSYLRVLDLSNNKITNINIFESVNFPALEELYLSSNNIKDLNVLRKFNFEKLTKLYLSNNKIMEINVLENFSAAILEELYLNINYIIDIRALKNLKCNNLQKLCLGYNNISDISILGKVDFPKLKKLDLSHNKISDISILSKTKFDGLQKLYLSENKISDIKVFGNVTFSQLQDLYLNMNEINDISVFERIKFYQLYGLYLSNNRIDLSFENNKNIIEKLKIIVKNLNI